MILTWLCAIRRTRWRYRTSGSTRQSIRIVMGHRTRSNVSVIAESRRLCYRIVGWWWRRNWGSDVLSFRWIARAERSNVPKRMKEWRGLCRPHFSDAYTYSPFVRTCSITSFTFVYWSVAPRVYTESRNASILSIMSCFFPDFANCWWHSSLMPWMMCFNLSTVFILTEWRICYRKSN